MASKVNVKDTCFRQGIRNVRVVGPWKELREMGDGIWKDAVHLTAEGYNVIADLVQQASRELSSKPEVSGSRANKRPRDEGQWGGGYRGRGGHSSS